MDEMMRPMTGIPDGVHRTIPQPPMAAAPFAKGGQAPEAVRAIGKEQVQEFTRILQKYKSGKAATERRIVSSENWWKLRNSMEEDKAEEKERKGFRSVSGWLHNVLVSKHADAMDAYPEPVVLPREPGDRHQARMLSQILPCVMEQNYFERVYSDTMWQKMKTGTGVYKVVWDPHKLNGLGDIAIERVNLLNIFWEPGITDIQRSRYVFHCELVDKDILKQEHPELSDRVLGQTIMSTKFLYDDSVDTTDKATVVEVYYHKFVGAKRTLQYCQYVEDVVLFASENDPEMSQRGFYDHGKFPYVFDALFPIEGSPCGYGFVDLCKNPQTEIDLLNTAFVKNAMVGATPRYFSRGDGGINEEEFLDLNKAIVHTTGNLGEDYLRRIEHTGLDGNYVAVLDRTIQELRETTGNTETSTGNAGSGVTAASAIAALQEASGKGSRDSIKASYRAFSQIVELSIEMIRQFYDIPRQFRILGQFGEEQFVSYDNSGIRPVHQGFVAEHDMGYRLPTFDVKVSAQKKNSYTRVAQNELALQFYQLGFFNPQMAPQVLVCLDIMEFDGKDELMQKISRNGQLFQLMTQYMNMSLNLAAEYAPMLVPGLSQDIEMVLGAEAANGMANAALPASRAGEVNKGENSIVTNARARAAAASQPGEGTV